MMLKGKATEKQIKVLERAGIQIPLSLSKQEASNMISKLKPIKEDANKCRRCGSYTRGLMTVFAECYCDMEDEDQYNYLGL